MPTHGSRRLPVEQRRALIIEAAQATFAQHGYEGTSTDAVAQAADVSQGHVIRLFGTKKELFTQVVAASLDHIHAELRTAIPATADPDIAEPALGRQYLAAVAARPTAPLVLFRLISSGSDPDLAELARTTIASLYRLLRDDAGFEPADASRFLANGLLTSALAVTGMRVTDDADERELIEQTVQGNIDAYTGLLQPAASKATTARRRTRAHR